MRLINPLPFSLLVFLLLAPMLQANEQRIVCRQNATAKAPFFISDEYKQGDKIWENLRNLDNHKKVNAYIPRGSIVVVDKKLRRSVKAPDALLPVRVLSLPNQEIEEELKTRNSSAGKFFKNKVQVPQGRNRAKRGNTGFLNTKALIPAGEFTFLVKKDSTLYNSSNLRSYKNSPLTLKMTNGMYEGRSCCHYMSHEDKDPACYFEYIFEALDENGVALTEIPIGICKITDSIVPVPLPDETRLSPINKIVLGLNQEYPGFGIDKGIETEEKVFSGLRVLPNKKRLKTKKEINNEITKINRLRKKLKRKMSTSKKNKLLKQITDLERKQKNKYVIQKELMVRIPLDHETQLGPYNSFHYSPDDKSSNDAFARPTTMCTFLEVLKEFDKECKGVGCQVQFGNMYHEKSWGTHSSHGDGTCIDLRPQRKGNSKNNDKDISIKSYSPNYDQERTKKLISIAAKAGANPILFGDTNFKSIKGYKYRSDHKDHIHLCFKPDNDRVKKACHKGYDSLDPLKK